MFACKDLNLLVLVSKPGLGKSQAIKEALKGKEYFFQSSHATPLSIYNEIYNHKDSYVVLEDIDSLMESERAVSMLKCLCETTAVKTMHYRTTSSLLKAPTSYEVTASTLISCNKMNSKDENVKALLSRGLVVYFEPSKQELLKKMREILPKIDLVSMPFEQRQGVLGFIEKHSAYALELNLRTLVRGLELYAYSLKDKELDWKATLLKLMQVDEKLVEVIGLVESGKPVAEQVEAYSGSRSQYFKIKKEMKK